MNVVPRISSKLALNIATVNQNIDFDNFLVGTELGYEIEKIISIEEEFPPCEEEGKERKNR